MVWTTRAASAIILLPFISSEGTIVCADKRSADDQQCELTNAELTNAELTNDIPSAEEVTR
jgi:hypothetical protein